MPVASHKWSVLAHEEFKAWVDAGGPAARHEVMRVTGRGKSTVSTWVIGRCAPPPEQQNAILALMRDSTQRQPVGSLPLERQRAAQRDAGLAKKGPPAETPWVDETEIQRCVERALERIGGKGQIALGSKDVQFGGAPVLGVVPVVVTIRIEDSRGGK